MPRCQVTTFYSYKGGSGRSMALSNVAWALATNGEKVLAIDWDLEAPGLNRYFHPFLRDPEQSLTHGLIDRIWDYVQSLAGEEGSRRSRFDLANCDDLVQPLDLPVNNAGCLHFIGAGVQDKHYSEKVNGLDWTSFYRRFDGEAFINKLIEWARDRYTHVLIDSRTGVADTAGICTTQLPDALVLCFVYNRQSIEGTVSIARSIIEERKNYKKSAARMEFVPSRVEERSAVEPARRYMAQRLMSVIDGNLNIVDNTLRLAEIRNYPWCAFEEKLAAFEELPDERGSLLDAMHALARRVSGLNRLQIAQIDRAVLASYWQRAAFVDPRIFDLRGLGGTNSSSDSWKQLQYWLESTDNSPHEQSDWLIELAETAMLFATSREGGISPTTADYFATTAMRLARRAVSESPHSYQTRFAFLLHQMVGILQRKGNLDEALKVSIEAERQWQQHAAPTVRWRCALTMERKADIFKALGRPDAALATYREIIDLYRSLGRRKLPIGTELAPARAHRLLAQGLAEGGDYKEANDIIAQAVKMLPTLTASVKERDISEVTEILVTRLRIASQVEPDNIDKVGHKILALADRVLPGDTAREHVIVEFIVVQAEVLSRHGQFEAALARIEHLPYDAQLRSRAIDLKAELLINLDRPMEAADQLSEAISGGGIPVTANRLNLIQKAFHDAGQEERFNEVLINVLETSKLSGTSDFGPFLRLIFNRALKTGSDRVDVDVSKLAAFLPSLLEKKD